MLEPDTAERDVAVSPLAARAASTLAASGRFSPAAALLLGWAVVALVNVVVADIVLGPPRSVRVRLLHHAFASGQALGAGVLAYAIGRAWTRWAPKVYLLGHVLVLAAAIFAGGLLLQRDVHGLASTLPGHGVWEHALGQLCALVVPAALWLGARMARPWARPAAVAVAVAIAAADSLVLESGYLGIHLFLEIAAACLAGTALAGARIPEPLARLGARARGGTAALALGSGAAALVLVAPPRNDVMMETLRVKGEAFTPFLAEVRARFRGGAPAAAPPSPWFRSRAGLPAVPPSAPLVGDDAIVVFITVDALRADVVNDERYAAKLPAIHALRKSAVAFDHARSTAPQTSPSLSSIMTGKYYSMLYWTPWRAEKRLDVWPREDTTPRFTNLLSSAAIPTALVCGMTGFADPGTRVVPGYDDRIAVTWKAPQLVDAMIARLRQQEGQPLFLHAHFMEPHAPYDAPGATPFDKYLGEVEAVDAELRRLLDVLAEPEYAARTVVVFTADHGEAFGEHNTHYHSVSVYDELLRVPLLIRAPGIAPRVDSRNVSLIDLGPTFLDLFGQPTPAWFLGQSLVPKLRGEADAAQSPARPIAAESGRGLEAMVFDDGYKVIHDLPHGIVELYDLNTDPAELDNLADDEPKTLRDHLGVLRAFFDVHRLRRPGYHAPYRR
ncbi:MAG TPA: sulfatase [Minicystis sp.]|nr:sulfatase [Minicystis sp.]